MKKYKFNFRANRLFITAIILVIFFIAAVAYFFKILKTADYFKIKELIVNEEGTQDFFSYLKGRGIFNIDLKKETEYISGLFPAYKKIRIVRVLPDRVAVYFSRREAVAYVKLYRDFCVDREYVLFDAYKGEEGLDLPIIVGLETKIFGPKAGNRYNIGELRLALEIAKETGDDPRLEKYIIKRIDVANPANATCFLYLLPVSSSADLKVSSSGFQFLEVRLGENGIREKVNILSSLLGRMKGDLDKIKYIDLRFREPVIKHK